MKRAAAPPLLAFVCLLLRVTTLRWPGGSGVQFEGWRSQFKSRPTHACLLVGWLLKVQATGECISGTDLLRQLYVLPH